MAYSVIEYWHCPHLEKRLLDGWTSVRLSVCLSHRSTAAPACGEFATERAKGRRYRSIADDGARQQKRAVSRWEPREEADHRLYCYILDYAHHHHHHHHHHHFICPIIQQYAHLHEYDSRRAGQQGLIRTLTAALKRSIKTVTGCIFYHTNKNITNEKD